MTDEEYIDNAVEATAVERDEDVIGEEQVVSKESFNEMVLEQTKSFTEAAKTIINNTSVVRRIPESWFYFKLFNIIRDHFTGKTTDGIGFWLNVADGMTKEISVFDEDTQEEIFRIPPFNRESNPIMLVREEGKRVISPNDLVENQELYRRNGDMRNYMAVEEALPSLYPIHGQMLQLNHIENLIKIYNRYELPVIELLGDQADTILAIINDSSDTPSSEVASEDTSTDISDYDF